MGIFSRKTPSVDEHDLDLPVAAGQRVETRPSPSECQAQEQAGRAPNYGIEKAIELMRLLPVDDDSVELTVQVIKKTLESTGINIASILGDAKRKQDDIQGRIKTLQEEVAGFKKEITRRNEEIQALERDYQETTLVRERLMLVEKPTQQASPLPAPPPPAKKVDSGNVSTAPVSIPSQARMDQPRDLDLSWTNEVSEEEDTSVGGHRKTKGS